MDKAVDVGAVFWLMACTAIMVFAAISPFPWWLRVIAGGGCVITAIILIVFTRDVLRSRRNRSQSQSRQAKSGAAR